MIDNEFKGIEQIIKKYVPFPVSAQHVEIMPDGYIITENGKTFKIKVSEHIPNVKRGANKKVSN